MADGYTELPYVFDLLYDVKSVESLHDHLTGKRRLATSATDTQLITLAREEGIPLPEGLREPPATLAQRNADAMELLKLIHAQAQRGEVDVNWLRLATSEALQRNGIAIPK
jgi:hypothetical protein